MYINQTFSGDRHYLVVFKYVMVSSKVGFCLTSYLSYMLTVCMVDWRKGCRFSHRWLYCCDLVYADDVTLIAPSRSGIRNLINVCEQVSLDYDITFNRTKHHLLCFKGRFSYVSDCGFHVTGHYVEVSKCTVHIFMW